MIDKIYIDGVEYRQTKDGIIKIDVPLGKQVQVETNKQYAHLNRADRRKVARAALQKLKKDK